MADNDIIPTGITYANALLGMWQDCLMLSEAYRVDILSNKQDNLIRNAFIAKLLTLRKAIYPLVVGNIQMKSIKERIDNLPSDPKDLLLEVHLVKIWDLEDVLGEAMEQLKITKYEPGV